MCGSWVAFCLLPAIMLLELPEICCCAVLEIQICLNFRLLSDGLPHNNSQYFLFLVSFICITSLIWISKLVWWTWYLKLFNNISFTIKSHFFVTGFWWENLICYFSDSYISDLSGQLCLPSFGLPGTWYI